MERIFSAPPVYIEIFNYLHDDYDIEGFKKIWECFSLVSKHIKNSLERWGEYKLKNFPEDANHRKLNNKLLNAFIQLKNREIEIIWENKLSTLEELSNTFFNLDQILNSTFIDPLQKNASARDIRKFFEKINNSTSFFKERLLDVSNLNFSKLNLREIPDLIQSFANLVHVSALGNRIKSLLPSFKFTELKTINFQNNCIQALPLDLFEKFPMLHTLILAKNNLIYLPEEFSYIKPKKSINEPEESPIRLHYLDLSENNITNIPNATLFLKNLPCLTTFKLDKNQIALDGKNKENLEILTHCDGLTFTYNNNPICESSPNKKSKN